MGGLYSRRQRPYAARRMRRRYSTPLTVAAAVLLTLGSLQTGWWLDDHYQRWIFLGSPVYSDVGLKPMDAFIFWDGDPQRNQRMMDIGMLPWWSDPHVKAAFWRPITALTHILDYRLWPTSPRLMHVHSIIWFALWVFSACLLYRGIMRPTLAATLAGVLYGVAHA